MVSAASPGAFCPRRSDSGTRAPAEKAPGHLPALPELRPCRPEGRVRKGEPPPHTGAEVTRNPCEERVAPLVGQGRGRGPSVQPQPPTTRRRPGEREPDSKISTGTGNVFPSQRDQLPPVPCRGSRRLPPSAGQERLPGAVLRRPRAKRAPLLPGARDLRMCEGSSWQLRLDGRRGPALQQEALSSGAWSRPSAPKQEELLGENVSAVSTPGRDLLPPAGNISGSVVPSAGVRNVSASHWVRDPHPWK